ncbi:MAG: zinc ribbon domain-containing protein [Spirochaetaceae bacterium]|nr:hypothetical protein [Myxococcales bacterium]MCB9723185.1 zinc ribbon domain-containing protein [Spirochaetaceae bacterium]
MPVYEYLCEDCGGFTALRSLEDYKLPEPCPGCARPARRAVLTAPSIASCGGALRKAHRRNEASVERPRRGRATSHAGHAHAHPSRAGRAAGGRPWMLSH